MVYMGMQVCRYNFSKATNNALYDPIYFINCIEQPHELISYQNREEEQIKFKEKSDGGSTSPKAAASPIISHHL